MTTILILFHEILISIEKTRIFEGPEKSDGG